MWLTKQNSEQLEGHRSANLHLAMEEGRQGDAPAAAAASGGSVGGGSGVASDERQRRRQERERLLPRQITDTEGVLSYMMAFLPLHLMVQLSKSIWQQAAPDLSDVTISSATKEERSFWQHVHLEFVTQLAARLTRLMSVTVRYPFGAARWCLDVFVAMVEGHIAGRRAAANMKGGTLETITFQQGVRLTGTARQPVTRTHAPLTHPPFPPPLDPPPTLDALTTIEGLRGNKHWELTDRGWRLPSLAIVQQEQWRPDRLGRLISSSRSLQRVGGGFDSGGWAGVFKGIPAAPAGQQGGPLAQLESIGTVVVVEDSPVGVDQLQEALVARGCRRTLKQLQVEFADDYRVGRRTLPVLLALDRLILKCCQPDAQLSFPTHGPSESEFDLDTFYDSDFPPRPSASFKTMMQQLASRAYTVHLSFDEATEVVVKDAYGFDPPDDTPSPHPSIITHMQPFPNARELSVFSELGGAAGRLLADKMPIGKQVESVTIDAWLPDEGEKVGVLMALGRDREVGVVRTEFRVGQLLGGAGDRLPKIRELPFMTMTMYADVEDAGRFVRTRLSALIRRVRGLRRVQLKVYGVSAEQHDSITASLPDGANIGALTITSVTQAWGNTLLEMTAPSHA
ncbi:unnamed protein product [Vitrella brassicaformis CCMP3155]|uniref:Uncharacterized protein n=1 Tax=Vitrella brassicaformis (strain CCMP3155) TaxID=1169540 RepID=A0A0G4EY15_VITBC|nr:unnamed protein product [Vitrella brassicaformis CCMP3155]|eukprot:CEM04222.1 unnamed protein product [Vitrella brassicaformis CCMP3155]